jgi:BCD family chlorophyll transporter-like MFS transporter
MLTRGADPLRVAALGAVVGLPAFVCVVLSAPLDAPWLFRAGVCLIGIGAGLFAVGTLTAAMALERAEHVGLALGAWGAVQATAAGASVAAGGALRDLGGALAQQGWLGSTLASPVTGYGLVYHIELGLLLAALIALGPLTRHLVRHQPSPTFGLANLPG